jgi:hypothetical protein
MYSIEFRIATFTTFRKSETSMLTQNAIVADFAPFFVHRKKGSYWKLAGKTSD